VTRGPKRGGCGWDRDRAVSAVVGKSLEAGIVVLYISTMVGVLYGGVVPEYQATTGEELGERVLAESVLEVQTAVPADPEATGTTRHQLPRTIDDEPYRIVASNDSLRLVHDTAAISTTIPLRLPSDVQRVEGEWRSSAPAVVTVEQTSSGRVVRLEAGSA